MTTPCCRLSAKHWGVNHTHHLNPAQWPMPLPQVVGRALLLDTPKTHHTSAVEHTASSSNTQTSKPVYPLDLGRFAYRSAPKSSNAIASAIRPARFLSTMGQASTSKPSLAPIKQDIEINTEDLNKVSKCVCCDLSWTSRKTAPQKLKHIRLCAKKNHYTRDIVQSLVSKLVKSIDIANGQSMGGPSRQSQASRSQNTLLGNVMHDANAGPKKRTRRPQVTESVKSLTDTRDNILARARLLLVQPSDETPTETAISVNPPSRTQKFGESALARRNRNKASLLGDSYSQPYIPTQVGGRTRVEGPDSGKGVLSDREANAEWVPTSHADTDRLQSPGLPPLHRDYPEFTNDVGFRATHSYTSSEEAALGLENEIGEFAEHNVAIQKNGQGSVGSTILFRVERVLTLAGYCNL